MFKTLILNLYWIHDYAIINGKDASAESRHSPFYQILKYRLSFMQEMTWFTYILG